MRIVLRNKKGVTLVEVMISLVILLVVFLGLIQASLLSIEHNMKNEMRDEAVRIAAAAVERLKQIPFREATTGAAYDQLKDTGGAWVDRDLRFTPSTAYDAATNTDAAAGSDPQVLNSGATVWKYVRNIRQRFIKELRVQNLDATNDADTNLTLKRVEVRVKYNDAKTGEERSYTVSTTVRNK